MRRSGGWGWDDGKAPDVSAQWLTHAYLCAAGGSELWSWTLDLMREHRGLIERVATELWHRLALDGDEIDALMHDQMLAS